MTQTAQDWDQHAGADADANADANADDGNAKGRLA